MESGLVFDLNPVIIRIGVFRLSYYGVIFSLMILVSYLLWQSQMVRGGYSQRLARRFLVWGVIFGLAGCRIGHCLFYHPVAYLSDPMTILYYWRGGLSSHGGALALIATLFFFSRRHRLNVVEMLDRFSMSAAVMAASVRLGNFFNSEIVGRATDLPWAVRFMRYDNGIVARHPSQLYEFSLGMFVLAVIVAADRRSGGKDRPVGLLAGLFLTAYFGGRFFIEFVKAHHVLDPSSFFTMGQYLSIPFFIFGAFLLSRTRPIASTNDLKATACHESG